MHNGSTGSAGAAPLQAPESAAWRSDRTGGTAPAKTGMQGEEAFAFAVDGLLLSIAICIDKQDRRPATCATLPDPGSMAPPHHLGVNWPSSKLLEPCARRQLVRVLRTTGQYLCKQGRYWPPGVKREDVNQTPASGRKGVSAQRPCIPSEPQLGRVI